MPVPFGSRLATLMRQRGPLCVGIDPHPGLLAQWGLPDTAAGLAQFTETVVRALAGQVAALKPQSAFYERFGSAGIAVLEQFIPVARAQGTLVIMDAKRGDIGSTMTAYAQAYLDPSAPLASDALTISPFLGLGSLEPAFDLAATHGSGVFALAFTSNPEGSQVQQARTGEGTVSTDILTQLGQRNTATFLSASSGTDHTADQNPVQLGSFGAVIGATVGAVGFDLTQLHGPILAPGLGAQGATPQDLATVFGPALPQVLPMYGRSILAAGPAAGSLRAAAEQAAFACAAVIERAG